MTAYPPLHAGAAVSDEHAAHILAGLHDRTLPKTEWTHGAHLTAAVALLGEGGLAGALGTMPDLIRRYNEAAGGRNTDTEGYHHTITVFYLNAVAAFCAEQPDTSIGGQATALLSSPLADPNYPLTYYSKDVLFSVEARRGFVAPDRKVLPGPSFSGATARE